MAASFEDNQFQIQYNRIVTSAPPMSKDDDRFFEIRQKHEYDVWNSYNLSDIDKHNSQKRECMRAYRMLAERGYGDAYAWLGWCYEHNFVPDVFITAERRSQLAWYYYNQAYLLDSRWGSCYLALFLKKKIQDGDKKLEGEKGRQLELCGKPFLLKEGKGVDATAIFQLLQNAYDQILKYENPFAYIDPRSAELAIACGLAECYMDNFGVDPKLDLGKRIHSANQFLRDHETLAIVAFTKIKLFILQSQLSQKPEERSKFLSSAIECAHKIYKFRYHQEYRAETSYFLGMYYKEAYCKGVGDKEASESNLLNAARRRHLAATQVLMEKRGCTSLECYELAKKQGLQLPEESELKFSDEDKKLRDLKRTILNYLRQEFKPGSRVRNLYDRCWQQQEQEWQTFLNTGKMLAWDGQDANSQCAEALKEALFKELTVVYEKFVKANPKLVQSFYSKKIATGLRELSREELDYVNPSNLFVPVYDPPQYLCADWCIAEVIQQFTEDQAKMRAILMGTVNIREHSVGEHSAVQTALCKQPHYDKKVWHVLFDMLSGTSFVRAESLQENEVEKPQASDQADQASQAGKANGFSKKAC